MSRAKEVCYFLKDQIKRKKEIRKVKERKKILSGSIITNASLEESLEFISLQAWSYFSTGWENIGDKSHIHSIPLCLLSLKVHPGIERVQALKFTCCALSVFILPRFKFDWTPESQLFLKIDTTAQIVVYTYMNYDIFQKYLPE